jgi:hypothetical protein
MSSLLYKHLTLKIKIWHAYILLYNNLLGGRFNYMKIHTVDNKIHSEIFECDKEDLRRTTEDLGINIFDYTTELKATEDGTIDITNIPKIIIYDNKAYSFEATGHGTYASISDDHPIHNITDKHPLILIPDPIKTEFSNENALYTYIDDKIGNLLRGKKKILHREIKQNATEGYNLTGIHVLEINQND